MEPEAARTAGPYQDLHDRVSALVVTESSPDGAVTVDVGGDGTVRDLVLRDRGYPIDHYAAVIMDCLASAQARIPGLVEREVAATVGTADPGARMVLTDLRERFPEPAAPEWSEQPARARKPRREVDEDTDDWAGSRIMEDTI